MRSYALPDKAKNEIMKLSNSYKVYALLIKVPFLSWKQKADFAGGWICWQQEGASNYRPELKMKPHFISQPVFNGAGLCSGHWQEGDGRETSFYIVETHRGIWRRPQMLRTRNFPGNLDTLHIALKSLWKNYWWRKQSGWKQNAWRTSPLAW